MKVTASAPGKLVLSGEYAVLAGASAICMAIDRRARVTVEPGGADHHTIGAPGYSQTVGRFRSGANGIEWLEGGDEYALVEHVWHAVAAKPSANLALTLDSSEFAHDGTKIGIGSSAAVTVALVRAMLEPGDSDADCLQLALDAHRALQGGSGSGVDVASSATGGLIRYSMKKGVRNQLHWPDGLSFAVFWVGVPSSTPERLARLRGQAPRASGAALKLAAKRVARAWRDESAEAILHQYKDYNHVLREFSVDHDLGIFDAGHAELTRAADKAGVVYKPCGAGGGDTGIALACSQASIDAFVAQAATMGAQNLAVGIDPDGTRIEREST